MPLVSCPDLADEPVFLLAPGEKHYFRIQLVMRDIAGQVPLAVKGINSISFGSDDLDAGAAMQVKQREERFVRVGFMP